MTPYHRSLVFWLTMLTAAYNGAAVAVASMAPVFAESLPDWIRATIATVGVLIPVIMGLVKRWEVPRPKHPSFDDTDEAGA